MALAVAVSRSGRGCSPISPQLVGDLIERHVVFWVCWKSWQCCNFVGWDCGILAFWSCEAKRWRIIFSSDRINLSGNYSFDGSLSRLCSDCSNCHQIRLSPPTTTEGELLHRRHSGADGWRSCRRGIATPLMWRQALVYWKYRIASF